MKTVDELNKEFGAFYPIGHTVVGFEVPNDARQVVHELRALGERFEDIMELSAQQMRDFTERNLHEAGVMANMGTSLATVRRFFDAASQGAMFLIIPTPDKAAADCVSAAIHRGTFVLAERYHRLAIESVH